ncbi:pyridoxamine 5'-phosphate oxidase family protein [Paraburkholderia azotifigens]|uniref:2Fe-2S iron-sulfur cluster binding domain-containing protein n=1 Tax=Paraburkholderia azotifigens TaxID=2057004 RepID=A0A5C6VFA4_9BURK|nr:pyridoxamine 5'-phosphate oxidase family protein [Paraburkholderia azotifigens]TXC83579.1 2Fe-2S iron-sulfur cluster binding domain-containing protein [Paraburkholderia azotifigens]
MSDFIPLNGWGLDTSPFHADELAAQRLAGVDSQANSSGRRGIRRSMPDQHREFFAQQPFMVFGGVDASGQPWATIRTGKPGFVSSPDARTLRIQGGALPGDPLEGRWQTGAMIGGLGIQPHTRRRNRINGVVTAVNGDAVTLEVSQSFGNCAKYIQGRVPTLVERAERAERDAAAPQEVATQLGDADRALLAHADTFYIASANTADDAGLARGADVSHRGGVPGFVRVDDAGTLTTPDFTGNKFFNTIGNLLHDPRAGLLFIDFTTGDLLYLAVRAEIVWQGPELAAFENAERLMRFHVQEVRRSKGVLPFRWSEVDYAPQFATAIREAAHKAAAASPWHKLKVAKVVDETATVRSFYFESLDGAPLPPYQPGQYLPIRVPVEGRDAPLTRTYTLSGAHDPRHYRISVKREGIASNWLHGHLAAGMQIDAMAPRGAFVYDAQSPRPAVFVSAGIGITPMIAMLDHELNARAGNEARAKHLYFFHGARSDRERPFSAHLKDVAARHASVSVYLYDSAASEPADGITKGRVDIAALKRALPFDDYDFYLCGPAQFMRDLYEGLRALNVADERIRFEAFGPASVKRTPTAQARPAVEEKAEVEAGGAQVTFARSQRTIRWLPNHGSLLEFAGKNGIEAQSSCRSGMCGTCSTKVLSGQVAYDGEVEAEVEKGCALICMAHPVVEGENASLTLDL